MAFSRLAVIFSSFLSISAAKLQLFSETLHSSAKNTHYLTKMPPSMECLPQSGGEDNIILYSGEEVTQEPVWRLFRVGVPVSCSVTVGRSDPPLGDIGSTFEPLSSLFTSTAPAPSRVLPSISSRHTARCPYPSHLHQADRQHRR